MNASNTNPETSQRNDMEENSIEDFTQTPLEETGTFRAYPIAWTVEPSTAEGSKSVAIAFRFAIHQRWHHEQKVWSEEWPIGYYTENRTWVIGRDGHINDKAVSALQKAGLWDGDWDKIALPPPNIFVHIDVEAETFENKQRYRAAWIKPDADEPAARGGFAPANADLLTSLRSRFQSGTRAIAAGKPAGAAPTPPKTTPAITGAQNVPAQQPPAQAHTAPAGAPGPRPTSGRPQQPGANAQRPTAAPTGRPQPPAGPRPGPRPSPTPAVAADQAPWEGGEGNEGADDEGPAATGLEDVPF